MEAIRQLVLRIMTKGETGIIKTLPKKDLVDFNTAILAEKLMSNGVDPNAFKNADQVFNILKQIDQAETNRIRNLDVSSAKVFDLEGKEIPKGSKIMGGKAVDDDLPPPGSRGGDEDIAAPFQSQEETLRNMTEAEIKANLEAQNKATIEKIKERKRPDVYTLDDYDTTNMSEIKKEIIRTETKLGNLNPNSPDFRERAKPLIDKITDLQKKLRDDKADGGRAEYKFGIGPIKKLLDFANKKSPMKAYTDYLKSVKDRVKAGKEAEVAGEVIPIAATGALVTNQVKKKLKSMNEEERQKNKDEMFAEISQEYKERYKNDPEFLEKMLLSLHENIYMDKKAEGGRVGLKSGSLKKFLERRNFLKTIVGNSPEAENARILQKILDEQKQFKKFLDKNPPVKFPGPGDKEYDDYILRLNQIMAKDRLKSATGGRVGLKEGLGSFETNDPEEALKEIIRRMINVDPAKVPLSKDIMLMFDLNRAKIGGSKDIGGGELNFGINKGFGRDDTGIGFEYKRRFAEGGRIGYKVGGFDKARREFLKMLGIGAGTTAAAKSGILRFSDTAVPKAVEKVPINSSTLSTPPPYFFELAEKIKRLGKPDKVTYQERVEITRYTGKNGDEYELIEDLNTGDMRIQKDKMGVGTYGDKSFDTIEDRTVLEYKKGDADVDVETGQGYRSADEYEEYKVEFDADGTEAGADDLDAIVQKEIIEEAKGDAPSIKKASGGIARMLGE